MKKNLLMFSTILIATATFAQSKPKNMKVLRDSIFTVMKLSDENRQKMHEFIKENGKGQKAIKEDVTLTDEQRKEKLAVWNSEMSAKTRAILTAEQYQTWKDFGKSLKDK